MVVDGRLQGERKKRSKTSNVYVSSNLSFYLSQKNLKSQSQSKSLLILKKSFDVKKRKHVTFKINLNDLKLSREVKFKTKKNGHIQSPVLTLIFKNEFDY